MKHIYVVEYGDGADCMFVKAEHARKVRAYVKAHLLKVVGLSTEDLSDILADTFIRRIKVEEV
jgi:hypothetical protein